LKSYPEFIRERDDLNRTVMDYADTVIKRLYSLDAVAFRDGELDTATKDLIALAVSLALRCDDCVLYHLGRCAELSVPTGRVIEALGIASLIGGSITIPHLRRAIGAWHDILSRIAGNDFERLEAGAISAMTMAEGGVFESLQALCDFLKASVDRYGWVGFYLVDQGRQRDLVLGPYAGEPTEHTRISFGQGVCGMAAAEGKTFVVPDVSVESNYLSCSPLVSSEIVIPVWHGGILVGELDIDSHMKDAFCNRHRTFLERVAIHAAPLVGEASAARSGK